MRFRLPALACLLLCATTAWSQEAPPFQLIRSDEDWSVARDLPSSSGVPAFKYLSISDNPDAYLSLGGEWRERFDLFDAPRYGIGTAADDDLLQRLLIHADLHFNSRVRLFAQFGREDAVGKKEPLSPSDTDRGDVQNLFLDLLLGSARKLDLRVGRQELMFNPTQRFVSVREGPNVRQSFDGVRATWRDGDLRVDAFATRPVEYKIGSFDDVADPDQAFYGVYASRRFGPVVIDVYALGLERDRVAFAGQVGDERRHSVGARLAGHAGPWDYELEAIRQAGDFADRDIQAWAGSAIGGYTWPHAWKPRLALELDAGSGNDAESSQLETFNPLFPKGAYFNESSLNSWANSVVLRPSLTLSPWRALTATFSAMQRWRQSGEDAVYVQPYAPLPATLGNTARRVGRTYQFDLSWHPNRWFMLSVQIAHVHADDAVTLAGGQDTDFASFVAQYRF